MPGRLLAAAINMQTPLTPGHPLNDNLLGCWMSLPGRNGAWLPDLVARIDGSFSTSAIKWGAKGLRGFPDVVEMDGGTGVINLSTNTKFGAMAAVTWGGWAYPRTDGGGSLGRFITNNDTSTYATWDSSNSIVANCRSSNVTSGTWTLNDWQHVVAVFDGTRTLLYKDGVFLAQGSSDLGSVPATGQLSLGNRGTGGTDRGWDGFFNDVRIYNRALTGDAITDLYLEGRRGWPRIIQRVSSLRTFMMGTAAAAGNRRRRVLLTGTS